MMIKGTMVEVKGLNYVIKNKWRGVLQDLGQCFKCVGLGLFLLLCCNSSSLIAQSRQVRNQVFYVATTGNDQNSGHSLHPLRTIMAAAKKAMAGDTIMIHGGIYRERIDPPRGGTSPKKMIWYKAASGEQPVIKGSEVIKGWHPIKDNLWKVVLPNALFKGFNPYSDTIHGDWLERGSWSHSGEVYLNDRELVEARSLEQLQGAQADTAHWFAKVMSDKTIIWATFGKADPNQELVEINVRQSVFYPSKSSINYIGVQGLVLSQAATPWTPPTAEQIGLIGTHWSKGWIIENNRISHSKCVGVTLGKYGDRWDNHSASVLGYIHTIEGATANGWNKATVGSHLVRDNVISDCGQAGIAGSLGAVYSQIIGNEIHDIGHQQLFWGYEKAGIKLHGAVDVLIRHNHIYQTEGGIWLDWMAQGTRITGNLLHDNQVQDLSLEVNHGPVIIDNNIFLSGQQAQIRLSQGTAFIHNLISWALWPTANIDQRETPFLMPHTTEISGLHNNPSGDARFYNNIFIKKLDLSPFDSALLPVQVKGNIYLMQAKPSRFDKGAICMPGKDPGFGLEEDNGHWYLNFNLDKVWARKNQTVVIESNMLGKAVIPQQDFASPDGQPIVFDKDYLDRQRWAAPKAGPIEAHIGEHRIRVW